jgi:glycosyltransferase involved in cell wall biosynthesis
MRYAWHMRFSYFGRGQRQGLRGKLLERLLNRLRTWDRATATRVSHFVAISRTVQQRIAECYGRTSSVIYPPVDTEFYTPAAVPREDYYLVTSAFAPYKRLDLAVTACNRLGRRLVVIGQGQEAERLRALAGPTITFLGWQPEAVLRDHFRRCRALLFPGEEDFGIVPLEAQACGTPVIAYGRGGATETVISPQSGREPTGMWFADQTPECLISALEAFEASAGCFNAAAARRQALRFTYKRFASEFLGYLNQVLASARGTPARAA